MFSNISNDFAKLFFYAKLLRLPKCNNKNENKILFWMYI